MELKLDRNKTYGLALEGGGAKGAYQIGAWKALREAGIRFSAVSGTSVGALNGAMIVMDDLQKAEDVWNNIHFSQVMDVDDEEMRRLMTRDIPLSELKGTLRSVAEIIRNRGFDVTPLRKWVAEVVDADKVCNSDTDFFIVTYSLSDHQELELRASDLSRDELCDMLLASAYLPAFRLEKLGGKYYADGGVQDVVPIHARGGRLQGHHRAAHLRLRHRKALSHPGRCARDDDRPDGRPRQHPELRRRTEPPEYAPRLF